MPAPPSSDRFQHILALVLSIWFAFLALVYHQSFPAGTLPAHGVTLLVAVLIMASSAGLGFGPLRWLVGRGLPASEELLLSAGLGLGILSVVILILLSLGLGHPVAGWLLLASGLLMGGRRLAAHLDGVWGLLPRESGSIAVEIRARWWATPVAALAGAGWLAALAGALAPAEFYDALIYHLAVPDRFLLTGSVSPVPGLFYSQFPAGQGMLYALAMLLTPDRIEAGILAQLLHLLMGAGTVAATFLAGRRHLSPGAGLLAAGLVATIPGILLTALYPIADLGASFFGALVLLVLLEARRRDAGRSDAGTGSLLVLGGILAGLALGVKYTAAVSVVLPAASWLILRARRLQRARLLEIALFSAAVAASFSPWAIRNLATTGNPVSPYLASVFGAAESGPGLDEALASRRPDQGGVVATLSHVLTGPIRLGTERMGAGGYLGVALIFLIPFVVLGRNKPPSLQPLAVVALAALAGWAASVQVTRYLFPALPAVALLASHGAASLVRAAPLVRTPLAFCLGWLTLHNLYLFLVLALTINPFGVTFGVEMPEDYLARRVSYYPAASFINTQLPEEARIMLVGEGRGYYIERAWTAGSAFDRAPLARLAEQAVREGRPLEELLRASGITHLLVSRPEMERISRMKGRDGYFDHLAPDARSNALALLRRAAGRTLFQRNGVSVMAVPGG